MVIAPRKHQFHTRYSILLESQNSGIFLVDHKIDMNKHRLAFQWILIILENDENEIIIASSGRSSLTCETLGSDWSELQVWDMDFLQYITDVIYPALQGSLINLGLDVFSTYGQWRDKYQSKIYNDGNMCKLWCIDEPDNAEYGIIVTSMENGIYKIGDATWSGLIACWKPLYHTRNVRFSMKYANSLHKSMKVLAEEVSAMDPKIIMAPPNCYRPYIIQNSIFEAEIVWGEN
ncbi:hypothetical protein SNEBB_000502 [Seison nebaliae]|nr:hypothetical protein SNEBB_000502 [Seison nebaliae]